MISTCKRCGANLIFDPSKQKVYCSYCNQYDDVRSFSFNENNITTKEYYCSSCGAKISTIDTSVVSTCNFCGSHNFSLTSKKMELTSRKIIPFRTTKKYLIDTFKSFIASNSFAKKDAFSEKNIIETIGLYVPLSVTEYLVNYKSSGTISFNDNGAVSYKEYSYEANYGVRLVYDKLRNVEDNVFDSLLPYDLRLSVPFSPYYMLGFASSADDESVVVKRNRAINRLQDSFTRNMTLNVKKNQRNIVYPRINNNSDSYDYTTIFKKDYWVPIWICTYTYNNTKYHFAMNGQSGKIVANLPGDDKKGEIYVKETTKRNVIFTAGSLIVLCVALYALLFPMINLDYFSAGFLGILSLLVILPVIILTLIATLGFPFMLHRTYKKSLTRSKGEYVKKLSNIYDKQYNSVAPILMEIVNNTSIDAEAKDISNEKTKHFSIDGEPFDMDSYINILK